MQIGKAFFVANEDWLPHQAELRDVFKQGAEGVKNACDLASACDEGRARRLFNVLSELSKTPWTFKRASRNWDCCCECEIGQADFTLHVFSKSGGVIE
ncbi:MAG: hypothetical protein L0Z50_20020 [Verrucomicrobiales bacterium]|nr:hypothetical protein [Verrucomicrobiales bacterium]